MASSNGVSNRMQGYIVGLNRNRGFGFLRDELGEQRFFHAGQMLNVEIQDLCMGQSLIFEPARVERGLIARKVLALGC